MRTATHGAIRICRIPCGKPPHLLTNLGGRSTTKAVSCLIFADQDMLEFGESSVPSPFFLRPRQVACATLEWFALVATVAGADAVNCASGRFHLPGGAVFRKFLGASCNRSGNMCSVGRLKLYICAVVARSPFQTIQEARSVVEQFGCEVQISPDARLNRPFLPACPNITTFLLCIRATLENGARSVGACVNFRRSRACRRCCAVGNGAPALL